MGSGTSESHGELRKIDTGILYVTDKRFIFKGELKNYTYTIDKIVSVQPFKDAIQIGVEGRQKMLMFSTITPFLLGAAMQQLEEGSIKDSELLEYVTIELKMEIASFLKLIEGNNKITIDNFKEFAEVIGKISQCNEWITSEYSRIIKRVPHEIVQFNKKIKSVGMNLQKLSEEFEKQKLKKGTKISDEELENILKEILQTGKPSNKLNQALIEIGDSVNTLGIGEADIKKLEGETS